MDTSGDGWDCVWDILAVILGAGETSGSAESYPKSTPLEREGDAEARGRFGSDLGDLENWP